MSVAINRIHIRNRGGESGITVPYLDRMVTRYNLMMADVEDSMGFCASANFVNEGIEQDIIVEMVARYIGLIIWYHQLGQQHGIMV